MIWHGVPLKDATFYYYIMSSFLEFLFYFHMHVL